jgi:hypothetical protein
MMDRDEKGRFTEKNFWAYVLKNAGRPAKYETPEALLEKAYEYFEWTDQHEKGKYTYEGLKLWLGLDRSNWRDYSNRPEFSHVMGILKSMLLKYSEQKLGWAGSFAGGQYFLKCHGGEEWQDVNKTEAKVDMNNIEVVFAGAKNEGKPL